MAENLPAPLIDLADIGSLAADYARSSRSAKTTEAYRSDWKDYSAWCMAAGLKPIPAEPETIGLYLAARADRLKPSSLRRHVTAISIAHKLAGHHVDIRHPAISDVLAGIRRQLGDRVAPKNAISVDELKAMLRKLPRSLSGMHDKALLLIGFAGAFRRSELVALNFVDLAISSRGVAITVRRSKTDQTGAGQVIGIPRSKKNTCPVAALEAWLDHGGITSGPVFRPVFKRGFVASCRLSGEHVAQIVKRAGVRIGLDRRKIAGHSLRRGFMTAASAAGADLAQIMRQSRHRSTAVAMGYVDEGRLFANPASRAIGL